MTDRTPEQERRQLERCIKDTEEALDIFRQIPSIATLAQRVERLENQINVVSTINSTVVDAIKTDFHNVKAELKEELSKFETNIDKKLAPFLAGKEKFNKFVYYAFFILLGCLLLDLDVSDIKKLVIAAISKLLI